MVLAGVVDVLVCTIIVQASAKLNSSKLSRAQPIISEANRPAQQGQIMICDWIWRNTSPQTV